MTFYGYFRSSSAHRCRIAFGLKGVQPETAFIHLRKDGGQQKQPAYLGVNPQGLVPALDTGAGVLTQSLAIIEWLDETHPTPPPLLPKDPVQRAHVRAFAQIVACDIHPLQNLRVLDHLRSQFGADQAALDGWCRRWIGDGLAACEALATGAHFAFGETPTLADICLIPQMFSAGRFGLDLAPFPKLRAIFAHAMADPAFAEAAPAAQPDAE